MKLFVGFITYGGITAKYLPYFLNSLARQTFNEFKIIVIDNTEIFENANSSYIKIQYPKIHIEWLGGNIGFAAANNLMIKKAIKENAEYFLTINPDIVLEEDAIEKLLQAIEKDKKIAVVQPKILKWDFQNNQKTNIVDSYGLVLDKKFRFKDSHQGEKDSLNYIEQQEIFGFTGAAAMMRLKSLEDVKFCNNHHEEYFDELMFMYKEDCDLSMRLRLAGWKIVLESQAIVYHDRTAIATNNNIWQIIKNRRIKKKNIKKWSFRNQWIIILRYWQLPFSIKIKFWIWFYQLEALIFVLFFEFYLFLELIKLLENKGEMKRKRQEIKININVQELEKFMY